MPREKRDTGHVLYDPVYMTCPEQANPQGQKAGRAYQELTGGVGLDAGGCRVPGGGGNVRGLGSAMVAQLCKYGKTR